MKDFTTQDVIDIAVDLYDNKGFNRSEVYTFLRAIKAYGIVSFDIDRIFDLVVG